jgi:hypothetical protein
MACDADIPIKPSPMANAEAARIFIDLPFLSSEPPFRVSRNAAKLQNCGDPVSPMAAVPAAVAPAPMAMTPAPVTVAPMAVMPVMPPPHFFGLEAIDLVARGHGGMDIFIGGRQPALTGQLRRKRRGLRARGEGGGSSGKSNSEFQKISALHDISSIA